MVEEVHDLPHGRATLRHRSPASLSDTPKGYIRLSGTRNLRNHGGTFVADVDGGDDLTLRAILVVWDAVAQDLHFIGSDEINDAEGSGQYFGYSHAECIDVTLTRLWTVSQDFGRHPRKMAEANFCRIRLRPYYLSQPEAGQKSTAIAGNTHTVCSHVPMNQPAVMHISQSVCNLTNLRVTRVRTVSMREAETYNFRSICVRIPP